MNQKAKRQIKQITDEIAATLEELEEMSNIDESPAKDEAASLDYKVLDKLLETVSKLSVDIDFFRGTKELAVEGLKKAEGDFNSLSTDEKDAILSFIKESYKTKEMSLKAADLTQEQLTVALNEFTRDIDTYIGKLETKLRDLEVRIDEEEEKQETLRKDLLKSKLERGSKALEDLAKESLEFDRKYENLNLLEEELELAMMEQENEGQIENVRKFLDEKIQ